MKTIIPLELVKAYKARQITIYEIGEKIGRSPSTVFHALQDQGVDTTRHRNRLEERNRQVVAAYRQHRNLETVRKAFGLTKQRVYQIVERSDPSLLPRRKR